MCKSGYTEYMGACYKTASGSGHRSEIEGRCQEEGAHLVSIHSQEENDFVWNLSKD